MRTCQRYDNLTYSIFLNEVENFPNLVYYLVCHVTLFIYEVIIRISVLMSCRKVSTVVVGITSHSKWDQVQFLLGGKNWKLLCCVIRLGRNNAGMYFGGGMYADVTFFFFVLECSEGVFKLDG